MAVTAAMVKELRELTGAGMMDCKKALTEMNGDMEKAIEFLREKGLAAASKKAGRIAAEGLVYIHLTDDFKVGTVVEVNSETDFVAKNADFKTFVEDVAVQLSGSSATDIETFFAEAWAKSPEKTVQEELSSQIAVIGENLNIRRFSKFSVDNGFVEGYVHGGGRIGVLVEVEGAVSAEAREAAKNVAMQIAAVNPLHVSRDEVPAEYVEKEKEILKAQAINENPGKPENIIEKMIIGRLNKQIKEICLLDQAYVKDGDLTVGQYVDQVKKSTGSDFAIKRFIRFETGEGLAKKEEDFAAEVAKQING